MKEGIRILANTRAATTPINPKNGALSGHWNSNNTLSILLAGGEEKKRAWNIKEMAS